MLSSVEELNEETNVHAFWSCVTFQTPRKLTSEEAARIASQSQLSEEKSKASTAVTDVDKYK